MIKVIMLLITLGLMLSGCSQKQEPPLKIITNAWIGYSPLFYAKEKGWLKEHNIELSVLVSLGESMMTYRLGGFNGVTGTQYEYQKLNSQNYNLVPIIMFDRSNGGDMVMSNQSLSQLKDSTTSIDVYLETNSINALVFKDFIKAFNLSDKKFHFINKNQLKILTQIKQNTPSKPTIVVTYVPYNFELAQKGFKVLESTRNDSSLIVLDALFVNKDTLDNRLADLKDLKQIINKALQHLQENPQEFYNVVKPYLATTPSYQDFKNGLQDIKWLNKPIPDPLQLKMNQMNFETRYLL
ncbi:hypothetical protein JCM30760_00290 [Thiomicrorhabdus hydrogeniphila]